MIIRTRFSPSPTGNLHVGSLRTALYSWLFAKHHQGCFILRIEDTDAKRSTNVFTKTILESLNWLGLNWNEGPFFQTHRIMRYKNVIDLMLKEGTAYKCYCSSERLIKMRKIQILNKKKPCYDRRCRDKKFDSNELNSSFVVRFKNPIDGYVVFKDQVRGVIKFQNSELDDLIIQRSNGMPTYNFCVVVDDKDMNITHVIRGEDHINNTPRQINILNALGAKIPIYAHVSMVLNNEGKKISKRSNANSVMDFYEFGYLPEAILNYLLRLGWSCGDKEVFTLKEMIKSFNLNSISKSPSYFNVSKLRWLNRYFINHLPIEIICTYFKDYLVYNKISIDNGPDLLSLIELFSTRSATLKEMLQHVYYFYNILDISTITIAKEYFLDHRESILVLKSILHGFKKLINWNKLEILSIIRQVAYEEKMDFNLISTPLRICLLGVLNSPGIHLIIYLLGKKRTLFRIENALSYIELMNK